MEECMNDSQQDKMGGFQEHASLLLSMLKTHPLIPLGLNPGLSGEKSVTIHLSYGLDTSTTKSSLS